MTSPSEGHTATKRSKAWIQAVTVLGGERVNSWQTLRGRMRPGQMTWEDVGLGSHSGFPKDKVSAPSPFPEPSACAVWSSLGGLPWQGRGLLSLRTSFWC